jgi:lysophospholipase L1-like esterase
LFVHLFLAHGLAVHVLSFFLLLYIFVSLFVSLRQSLEDGVHFLSDGHQTKFKLLAEKLNKQKV